MIYSDDISNFPQNNVVAIIALRMYIMLEEKMEPTPLLKIISLVQGVKFYSFMIEDPQESPEGISTFINIGYNTIKDIVSDSGAEEYFKEVLELDASKEYYEEFFKKKNTINGVFSVN